jgi:YidC/Oxa1 family membrane protein insertase
LAQIFGFIINPMEWGLVHLALAVGNAGVAIILFTIIIRFILAPLTIAQLRNARAMARLQPHMAELRRKYGKDRQKLSEETMRLYREHQINPAMGCLPMILQFPVLIGLFYALMHLGSNPKAHQPLSTFLQHDYHYSARVFALFHQHFLWLSHGLGQPDPLYILPILAGVTQWVQSRMMLQPSNDPQQQTMNTMMNFMPLIIVFFALKYASGLSLYWVTSTLIGIIIQYKITGWGLLPRPQWLFRRASTMRPRTTSNKPRAGRSTGGNDRKPITEADTVLKDEPASGSLAEDEMATPAIPTGSSQRSPGPQAGNRRPSNRKRSSRSRGARRT